MPEISDPSTNRPPPSSAQASPTVEPRPVALTIAGSDSSGGAGIQADLRAFARLGVFGTSAISAVTAQNLAGVRAVTGIPAEVVAAQIEAVFDGFAVGALKTGMLWSAEIIARVAELVERHGVAAVIDPVMVATSGAKLLQEDAIAAYRQRLIPRCTLLTPNLDEARVLLADDPASAHAVSGGSDEPLLAGPAARDQLDRAAEVLGQRFGCAVLLKGGHLDGDPVDTLWSAGTLTRWRHRRVDGVDTHGSGCMLSAAIAAWLARGATLADACARGLGFVHSALAHPLALTPAGNAEAPDATAQAPGEAVHLAGIERATSDLSHIS